MAAATAALAVVAVWLFRRGDGATTTASAARASRTHTALPHARTFAPARDVDEDGVVSGEVLDDSGAPRAGAVVALVWMSNSGDGDGDSGAATSDDEPDESNLLDLIPELELARTDGRGRFRIATDRAGRARLTATYAGTIAVAAEPLTLGGAGAPAPAPTTLRLGGALDRGARPAARVEARAHEPEGSPVVDALVLARVPGEGLVFAARTDGNGAASLALPGWPEAIFARAEGYEDVGRSGGRPSLGNALVESDLVLVPGATLTGRVVVEATGEPASGARVRVLSSGTRRARGTTRAGADGRFRLTVGAGEVTARARRHGLVGTSAPVALERGHAADIVISLAQGGRITGIVRDSDGERPIAGARVRADGASTVTAADGTFVLDGIHRELALLDAQEVKVEAEHPDFCSGNDTVELDERGEGHLELKLDRCADLRGIVLDIDGKPAAGALVKLDDEHPTTTDPAGRFRISGLSPLEPRDAPDGGATERDRRQLVARTTDAIGIVEIDRLDEEIVIRLQRAAMVCGTVRDDEGRPVARAEIATGELRSRSDATGAYCIGPLDEGEWSLTADDGDPVELTLAAAERRTGVVLIAPARRADIRGVVESAEGPVWGARISGCGTSATSASDGSFTLPAPTDTRCGYVVKAPGFVDTMVELEAGDVEATITVERTPRIVGEVVDDKGRPVPRYGLVVRSSDVHHQIDDARGAFNIAVEQPGSYSLFVRTPDGRTGATPLLEVEGGQTVRARIVLGSACVLRFRVVDEKGAPIRAYVTGGTLTAQRVDDGYAIALARDGGPTELTIITRAETKSLDVGARCNGELGDIRIPQPPRVIETSSSIEILSEPESGSEAASESAQPSDESRATDDDIR